MALAWKNAHGDGEFQLLRMADTLLSERDVEHAAPGNAAALVLGSVVLSDAGSRRGAVSALDLAVSNNVPVVFDLNFRPFLWTSLHVFRAVVEQFLQYARVIKVSMDDARGVWGDDSPEDAIERLAAYGPTSVVVTDGVRGVWYQNGRANMRSLPVFEADVVEPTGAGDAFTAALTLRMLQRSWMPPDDDDIRFAMAAGALATTKVGAWSGLRSAESVQEFLADRG
jgi:sugar/nucleoside kinase (ribokinase family)